MYIMNLIYLGAQLMLIPFPSCFQPLHSFLLAMAQRGWGNKVKFMARCVKEKMGVGVEIQSP